MESTKINILMDDDVMSKNQLIRKSISTAFKFKNIPHHNNKKSFKFRIN